MSLEERERDKKRKGSKGCSDYNKSQISIDQMNIQNFSRCSKKNLWTFDEDNKLKMLVELDDLDRASNIDRTKAAKQKIDWKGISESMSSRTGKQCRERWHNSLRPDLKTGVWTPKEDDCLAKLQQQYGNKWTKISQYLPGRTDNAIKNRWHSAVRVADNAIKNNPSNTPIRAFSDVDEWYNLGGDITYKRKSLSRWAIKDAALSLDQAMITNHIKHPYQALKSIDANTSNLEEFAQDNIVAFGLARAITTKENNSTTLSEFVDATTFGQEPFTPAIFEDRSMLNVNVSEYNGQISSEVASKERMHLFLETQPISNDMDSSKSWLNSVRSCGDSVMQSSITPHTFPLSTTQSVANVSEGCAKCMQSTSPVQAHSTFRSEDATIHPVPVHFTFAAI